MQSFASESQISRNMTVFNITMDAASKQAYEKSKETRIRKHAQNIQECVETNLFKNCLFSDYEFNEEDANYYRSFGLVAYERPSKLWIVEWKTQDEIKVVLDQITERIGKGSI